MAKVDQWRTKEALEKLGDWARSGVTDEQIAERMNISRSTLALWKKKYSDISDTLKKNKEYIDARVESALLSNALKGDTTAQIFWLKNRRPDLWRDRKEVQVSEEKDRLDRLINQLDG